MSSTTYSQAIQVARERFTSLNMLDMADFNSFKEYMEVYNTLWEQGMEMLNFAREIEEDDIYLEDDCESIASNDDYLEDDRESIASNDTDSDASSRNAEC